MSDEEIQRRLTLFDILFLLVFFSGGAIAARVAAARYGWTGYLWGFLGGSLGPYLVLLSFVVAALAVQKAGEAIFTGTTRFPLCRRGCCRSSRWFFRDGDYRLESFAGENAYRCRCGDVYVKRGRRVFLAQDDGALQPYMIWKPLRGWRHFAEPQKSH